MSFYFAILNQSPNGLLKELFTLENFEPTEKLKESYSEQPYILYLDSTVFSIFPHLLSLFLSVVC